MKRNRRWRIPHSAHIKIAVKSKTVMSWSLQKKKEGIFVPLILSQGNVFNNFVLSQRIVY